jgi:hypothetical protein
MIFAQEQAFLKAEKHLRALVAYVREATTAGERIDQVERCLMRQLLQVGHALLSAFVAGQGDGDAGESLEGPGGQSWRRLAEPHERRYVSIFGELRLRRFVYGSREGQKIEAVPLDERLGLPAGEFSYVLEDWAQRLCTRDSYAEAGQALEDLLGLRLSVRTLEHMSQALAAYATPFRDAQPAPPADEEGQLLVFTADAKGVPMRRPLEERVQAHRRAKGEKANKKQMAYVGAVYSIDRFQRTAEDVLDELRRQQRSADRPVPRHKRVWTEMTDSVASEEVNGRQALFARLGDDLILRNRGGRKDMVCLLDGERALWDLYREDLPWAVGILDLFHVLEKLWQAAYCFHPEGSPAAEDFVTHRLRLLLEGRAGAVIGGLRQMATKRALASSKRKTLLAVVGYLEHNREHLHYDEYLAQGYPIGSGVAEGACRHVVKDRMERTGMRWTRAGAQAVLDLRATNVNGDWGAFIAFRIEDEQTRLYGKDAA